MFVAYDKDENRVYADDGVKHTGCVCPACGAEVIHKAVNTQHRVPHFAHKPKTKCSYKFDKDYMSEWHRRLQGYFAKEEIEVRFRDDAGKVVHIADAYCQKDNTVFEFQHSPISLNEFKRRTNFHLHNGRKVVWVFDVSSESNPFVDTRFIPVSDGKDVGPYSKRIVYYYKYKSLLSDIISVCPPLEQEEFAIYLYAMRKNNIKRDIIHRLVHFDQYDRRLFYYPFFVLSLHNIEMSKEMEIEEFFYPESHWLKEGENTWTKAIVQLHKAKKEKDKLQSERHVRELERLRQKRERLEKKLKQRQKQSQEDYDERFRRIMGQDKSPQPSVSSLDSQRAINSRNLVEEATKRAREYAENVRLDHEDYWKALLEYVDSVESPNNGK